MTPPVNRKRREKPPQGLYMRAVRKDVKATVETVEEALELPMAETGLPVRMVNMLEGVHILLVKDLIERKVDDLLAIMNFGDKTLKVITQMLEKLKVPIPEEWLDYIEAAAKSSRKRPPK